MFFSVHIPIYNCEKYLHKCIDSVLEQSFTDFELILVDDGSTDSSGSICDEYAEKDGRIKAFHQENCGLVATRRKACTLSSGKYILFVDADDFILPGLFERLYDVCKTHEPEMIAFDYETFGAELDVRFKNGFPEGLYKGENLSKVRDSLIYGERENSFNYGGVLYNLVCKVIRRDFWNEHFPQIPKEITKGEDLAATAVLVSAAKSLYFLDFCGYKYRLTPGSMMNTFKETETKNHKMVYDFITREVPSVKKNSISVWMMYMFLDYCRSAVTAAKSAADFESIIKRNTDAGFLEILNSARLSLPSSEDAKLMNLVKEQKFKGIYRAIKLEFTIKYCRKKGGYLKRKSLSMLKKLIGRA